MQLWVTLPLAGKGTVEDPIRPDTGKAEVTGLVVVASAKGEAFCVVESDEETAAVLAEQFDVHEGVAAVAAEAGRFGLKLLDPGDLALGGKTTEQSLGAEIVEAVGVAEKEDEKPGPAPVLIGPAFEGGPVREG